jgi:hypothetical protein
MDYMLRQKSNLTNVYTNSIFYISPIGTQFQTHPILRDIFGRNYHPTSVASFDGNHMVRFVNYSITDSGAYDMKESNYSANHKVRTQNAILKSDGTVVLMKDESISLPSRPHHILGLEDVRVYRNADQKLRFVGTSSEYSEKIRIVTGELDDYKGEYKNTVVVDSPFDASCEKNWIPVNGTNDILYSWNHLRIGHLDGTKLVIDKEHATPWLFQHIRGSAVPIQVRDELWCLVHFVMYSSPRKYYHCIVSLDAKTYAPKQMTLPFMFRSEGIEYCLSMTQVKNELEFVFSSWDDNPMSTRAAISDLEWIHT